MSSKLETKESLDLNISSVDFNFEEQFMSKLYHNLTKAKIEDSLKIYEEYSTICGSKDFIQKVLEPTISRIETDFIEEKISKASQHVAKNVSIILAKIISKN